MIPNEDKLRASWREPFLFRYRVMGPAGWGVRTGLEGCFPVEVAEAR